MSVIENDTNPIEKKVNHHKKLNGSHVAIVGCMAVSLGTAVVAGFKKSTTVHVVSALNFMKFHTSSAAGLNSGQFNRERN